MMERGEKNCGFTFADCRKEAKLLFLRDASKSSDDDSTEVICG